MKTSETNPMNALTVQRLSLFTQFAPYLFPSTMPSAFATWLDRQRAHLSRLDGHLLDDIAVSRAEAIREAQRWD